VDADDIVPDAQLITRTGMNCVIGWFGAGQAAVRDHDRRVPAAAR
jgi:hypothetical protein